MFIDVVFPQNSIEARVTAYDKYGGAIETPIESIRIEPYFFTPASVPAVLYAALTRGNSLDLSHDTVQRVALVASGRKCRLRLQDRTTPVDPLCELPEKKSEDS